MVSFEQNGYRYSTRIMTPTIIVKDLNGNQVNSDSTGILLQQSGSPYTATFNFTETPTYNIVMWFALQSNNSTQQVMSAVFSYGTATTINLTDDSDTLLLQLTYGGANSIQLDWKADLGYQLYYTETRCKADGVAAIVIDKTLATYPTLPATVTYDGKTYNVTSVENCYAGCTNLTGNLTVLANPSTIVNAFANTTNPIYVINGGSSSDVANKWSTIASQYSNVHYEANDNSGLSSNTTYIHCLVPGLTTNNAHGIYLGITTNILIPQTYLPVGWSQKLNTYSFTLSDSSTPAQGWNRTGDGTSSDTFKGWYRIQSCNQTVTLTIAATSNIYKADGVTIAATRPYTWTATLVSQVDDPYVLDFISGDYGYYIKNNSTVSAMAITNKATYATLPATISYNNVTYTVNELRQYGGTNLASPVVRRGCFEGCTALTTIPTINASVTSMERCFKDCTNLQQVSTTLFKNTVTNAINCFNGCTKLQNIPNLTAGLVNLSGCFANCIALTGNVNVYSTQLTSYDNLFLNTVNNIYILDQTTNKVGAQIWNVLDDDYYNVHYEFEDNPAPTANILQLIRGTYDKTNNTWEIDEDGAWVRVETVANAFNTFVPYNTTNIIQTKNITLDGDVIADSANNLVWQDNIAYIHLTTDVTGQHTVEFQIFDSAGKQSEYIIRILAGVFATLDLKAGGKGMAFGTVARHNGLEIVWPTAIGTDLELPTVSVSNNAIDLSKQQLAIGYYNEKVDDALFLIGNGINDEHRSNILVIQDNGDITIGDGDITVGDGNIIIGDGGITVGDGSITIGDGGITIGEGTNATDNQVVLGKYNVIDSNNTYAFIVGGGTTTSNRSNAIAIDWNGNIHVKGHIYAEANNSSLNGVPLTNVQIIRW